MGEPWVEKYRPDTLDRLSMSLESLVVNKIRSFTSQNVPNLMLFGVPGSSKTTAAICIAKHLGAEYVELNASDNRGINMISDLVNTFCRAVSYDPERIKVVILDEADNITKKAQQQLINFMENYPKMRVFFTCNDFDQMIEPLQSRCMLMKFPRPSSERCVEVIRDILSKECIENDIDAVRRIVCESGGDLRVAINHSQAVAVTHSRVEDLGVSAYFCQPNKSVVLDVIQLAVGGHPSLAMDRFLELNESGINGVDFMTMLRDLLHEGDFDFDRNMVMSHVHHCYYRMLNTMESLNQMARFFYVVSLVMV